MIYYICPYCDPCAECTLVLVKVDGVTCKYKNDKYYCRDKHKCKETFECRKCKSQFKPNAEFLRTQKRKDKDVPKKRVIIIEIATPVVEVMFELLFNLILFIVFLKR